MISTLNLLVFGIACFAPIFIEAKLVFYEDFSKGLKVNTSTSNYVYYSRKTYTANDGKLSVNGNKTVTQDVRPFKNTVSYGSSGTTDRYKSIVLQKDVWNVSKNQVLTCELKTWSKQWGVTLQKFGKAVTDPFNDVRLSTCGLYVGDPKSYIVAHFLQSVSDAVDIWLLLAFLFHKVAQLFTIDPPSRAGQRKCSVPRSSELRPE